MEAIIVLAVLLGLAAVVGLERALPKPPKAEPEQEMPEAPETPENEPDTRLMVDLSLLALRVEVASNAVEILLRQRGFERDADGARQVRDAVRSTFEQVKAEHLQALERDPKSMKWFSE